MRKISPQDRNPLNSEYRSFFGSKFGHSIRNCTPPNRSGPVYRTSDLVSKSCE
ncbi:hypothetical protein DPMN_168316 [Dreissena polymorpha]|uniref:Uncharacterized protein n=1 Tax=Dreissena polymorpha TaxID=45954 RepID=A0A9D4F4W8_DREPO|nr:hypothetical protein DPMN_168316 [Dreissena polymorpha]